MKIKEGMAVSFTKGKQDKVGIVYNVFVENMTERAEIIVPGDNEMYIRATRYLEPVPSSFALEDVQELINLALDTQDQEWFSELCARMIKGVK